MAHAVARRALVRSIQAGRTPAGDGLECGVTLLGSIARSKGPAADIVIPTYQNLAELRVCIDSLRRQDRSDFRVLVCVDGSTDGTAEFLTTVLTPFPLLTLTHPDRANHGRAATRNLALAHLRAAVVIFLDSDMVPGPGLVEAHRSLVTRQACVSVGAIRYANAAANDWARYLATRGAQRAEGGAVLRPLDFVPANSAVRSVDLLAVGGFDERLVGYGGEDTELGLRLAAERGIPFVFNAEARAATVETKTMAEGLAQLDRYARSNLRTVRSRQPDGPAPYWLDRLESGRVPDRALRGLMNPISDAIARVVIRLAPWPLRRSAINYLVLRTVWHGYREGPR